VASSSWGAQRIEQLILHTELQNVGSAGNGDVQIYEISISAEWAGRSITELAPAEHAIANALTRGGKTTLPTRDTVLQEHDILQVSATAEGASILRQRLKANGEKK
jgi:trk system potassium uptake protein TrkA